RAAAKARAKTNPSGQVVIHPVGIRYTFAGDLRRAVEPVLDMIEKRIGWLPQERANLGERIRRLGEALLSVKEVEYFGTAQPAPRGDRLRGLIDRVLQPLEHAYLNGGSEPTTVARVKKLRAAILPPLSSGTCAADERVRRWRHLDECSFAQALDCYPAGYI